MVGGEIKWEKESEQEREGIKRKNEENKKARSEGRKEGGGGERERREGGRRGHCGGREREMKNEFLRVISCLHLNLNHFLLVTVDKLHESPLKYALKQLDKT